MNSIPATRLFWYDRAPGQGVIESGGSSMWRFQAGLRAGCAAVAVVSGMPALAQSTFTVPAGSTQTVSTQISDNGSASVTLTLTGGGTLVLTNAANSYTGGSVVTGNSTVRVDTDHELGGTTGPLTLGDGSSSGTLSLTNTAADSSNRKITLGAGGGRINTSTASFTLGGTIAGPGGLTLGGGGGTLALTATNTFSGGTTILGGSTVQIGADSALGAVGGALTLGDASGTGIGSLSLAAGATGASSRGVVLRSGGEIVTGSGASWTFSGPISGSGALIVGGSGTITLSGSNSFTGGTTILGGSTVRIASEAALGNGGTLTLGDTGGSGTGTLSLASGATQTSTRGIVLRGGGEIDTGSNALWSLRGTISGTGGLTLGGTGAVVLAGTNTYSGGTTVLAGAALQVGADAALGNATAGITLGDASAAGTLDLVNTAAVSSGRSITLAAGGGVINTTTSTWTFTAPVIGAGGLTVGGSGTLILDGINTYSGTTKVTGGRLEIGDAASTGASLSGDVTVSGGTLSGHGSILGSLTNTAGIVAPGGSIGTLTVGSYTQSSSGTLTIEVSPTGASQLKSTGPVSLNGNLNLVFDPGFYNSKTYQIVTAPSITGTFATVSGSLGVGFSQTLSYGATAVNLLLTQLTMLPENPTVYTALTSSAIEDAQRAIGVLRSRLTDSRTSAMVDRLRISGNIARRDGNAPGASTYGSWVRGFGGFGTVSASNGTPGYDVKGGGFLAGVDFPINAGSGAVGVAFGYTLAGVDEHGGASGTVNTPRLGIYGGYWFGGLALDGSLDFGLPSFKGTRPIAGLGASSKGNFEGTEISGAIEGSLPMRIGPVAVTPALGFDYSFLDEKDFSESGTAFDINGHSQRVQSLRPFLSVIAAARFDVGNRTAVEPELRAFYAYETLSNARRLIYQAPSNAIDFLSDGARPGRGIIGVEAGLTVETSRAMAFGLAAGVEHSGNVTDTTVNASFRYRF